VSGKHRPVADRPSSALLFLILVELVLIAFGLFAHQTFLRPAPMVTNVQLPDVAGDGS
jgi:hypothetical protein